MSRTCLLEQLDDDRRAAVQARPTEMVECTTARSVAYRVVDGEPAAAIVQTAVQVHADLIVMGRHVRHRVLRWRSQRVTDAVASQAPCPVLIVTE